MNLTVDAQSPIPIRRQLTEQLKHVIESGGVPQNQTLPSIRELAGFLGINTNTQAERLRVGPPGAGRVRGLGAAGPPVAASPRALPARDGHAGGRPRDDR